MGTWNIKCAKIGVDVTVSGNETLSYEFDPNDEDEDLIYNITYTDDDGCTGATTFIHKKCQCESKIVTKVEQDGDCFCGGINYTIKLYDECDESVILNEKSGNIQWTVENAKDWTKYGEVFNQIEFTDDIEYEGEIYQANVSLTSECYVKEIKVYVQNIGHEQNVNLHELGGGVIPLSICGYDIDIAGNQEETTSYYKSTVKWNPTDSLTICENTDCNLENGTITFPQSFTATVGIDEINYERLANGIYAGQNMSSYMRLTHRIEQTPNSVVNVYIQVEAQPDPFH